jgi:drug/metabolite transporter (DMT)-like permease
VSPHLIGGLAALGSGFSWALGSILFRDLARHNSALGLNLCKALLGLVYLGIGLCFVGWAPMDTQAQGMLILSGVVGISLGDTLFFMALVRLEPRRCVLLATVGQAMTIGMAMVLLDERPAPMAWLGIIAIIGGVTWVMLEQTDDEAKTSNLGMVLGLGAAACMAVSIISAKVGVGSTGAIQATMVRMAGGVAGLGVAGILSGRLGPWLRPLKQPAFFMSLARADVVIIGGGFTLSMVALSLTDASMVSVLTATEPIFILPLSVWLLREKLSRRSIVGAVLATGGVALIMGTA